MPLTRRSRALGNPTFHVTDKLFERFTNGNTRNTVYYDANVPVVSGSQVTDSEGHPWSSKTKKTGDIGGPFGTTKSYIEGFPSMTSWKWDQSNPTSGTYIKTLDTRLWPMDPRSVGFPQSIGSSDAGLATKGATAIARSSPTNSIADAATFLGELVKDGIPSIPAMNLWKRRIRLAADLGDEFLNYSFGWLPLVSDIKSHAKAVTHADTVMKQYERDAGKLVRRSYVFPTEVTKGNRQLVAGPGASPWYSPGGSGWADYFGYGSSYLTVETVKRTWFSGGFTYHLPSDYDSRKGMARNAEEAKRVFGATLTPDTLWELTPWSWAIDWFTNAGDVVHNLSSWKTFGLVLRYGYMMEHSINKYTYTFEFNPGDNRRGIQIEPVSFVTETKKRIKANPFGFGISWDSLSPFQLAITAALGLSRT